MGHRFHFRLDFLLDARRYRCPVERPRFCFFRNHWRQ
jgi:hypothetical protein